MYFILGAQDPEMNRIEEILKEQGCYYSYAMKDGHRVRPWEAYKADQIKFGYGKVVLVECGFESFDVPARISITRVDHHNPGDYGYSLPTSEFLKASSLGQIYRLLKMSYVPDNDIVLAAMDHCPFNAICGDLECYGVSAKGVLDRKIQEVAAWLKVDLDTIKSRVEEMSEFISSCPVIEIGSHECSDCRDRTFGASSDLNLRCASIAALAGGHAVLFRQQHDGKTEWSLQGHCTPECIEAFIQEWGPANGLTGLYGVPARGYAGGYLPE